MRNRCARMQLWLRMLLWMLVRVGMGRQVAIALRCRRRLRRVRFRNMR